LRGSYTHAARSAYAGLSVLQVSFSIVKVLVVDDSAAVRARLVVLLGELPRVAAVLEARNAVEALAVAEANTLSVIVLDLHMPGEHGLALLPRLRRAHAGAVVIVLTNDASPAHQRECRERGADFFFDKSNDFERIADVVASARAVP
jgi:two-component system OmpR family response regulator